MKLFGRVLVLGMIGLGIYNIPVILVGLILFFVGLNLAHGKGTWPDDYYRKSLFAVTWREKVNPWWWTLNDDDPITLEKNNKFWPDDVLWKRKIKWWIRNPTCNLDRYVLGFWDKKDWWTRERKDNMSGWDGNDTMWPLPGKQLSFCLPFFSWYSQKNKKGQYWEFYTGWKPNGEFGWICLRRKG